MTARSILIVDDDARVRESLFDQLSPSFEVRCVDGADAALEELTRRRFDLLLTDLRTPGADAVELARRAHRADPEMVRVLITGHADANARETLRERDGVYVLNKPGDDELQSVLHRALEHRERLHRVGDMMGDMDRMATLGRMLMSVVHDLSTPLSYVQVNLSTLARDLEAPSLGTLESGDTGEIRELLRDVRAGLSKIVDLVQRLRQFAAPDSEELATVGLGTIVDSAIRVTHSQLRHRVKLDLRKNGHDPMVRARGRDVEQIVVNLLLNAAHAMDWKGSITLEVKASADRATVAVTDRGPATQVEDMDKVFDPLFAGQSDWLYRGLQLTVARSLASRYGGVLRAESNPRGEGSTTTLELPIVEVAKKVA